jgi:hypothetical protein
MNSNKIKKLRDVDVIKTISEKAIKDFLTNLFGKSSCLHCNAPNRHVSRGMGCLCRGGGDRHNCYYKLSEKVFNKQNFSKLIAKKRYTPEILLQKAEELAKMAAASCRSYGRIAKLDVNPRLWNDDDRAKLITKSMNAIHYYF